MSVPTRSQSRSRFAFRTQACRSGVNGRPGDAIGRVEDSHMNSPPVTFKTPISLPADHYFFVPQLEGLR